MPGQLTDRVVVITGSSRGFGYSIAEAALKAGATVTVTGRDPEALGKAVESLASLRPVHGERLDVRREAQAYELVDSVLEKFGRIDIWINNAGFNASAGTMLDTNPQEALDMFLSNDLGMLHCTQAVLPHMLSRREGTLVNLYGNGSFLRPATPTGLYGATKAWVTSFTRSLARELADSGVKLIGFSPGMLLTDMLTRPRVVGERGREMMKRYDFVLRLLARNPGNAANKLVQAIAAQRKPFEEIRLLGPRMVMAGLLQIAWEGVTGRARPPQYEMEFEPAYRFRNGRGL